MITGIDESGKGAIFGPMCVAAASIDMENINKLNVIGLRDAKELSKDEIVKTFHRLERVLDNYAVSIVSGNIIKSLIKEGIKNDDILLKQYNIIIEKIKPTSLYIDSIYKEASKFCEKIIRTTKYLPIKDIKIIAANNADKKFQVVKAASIIATYYRNVGMEKERKIILDKTGIDVGSGYPNNSKLKRVLKDKKNIKKLEPFIRYSRRY